MQYGWWKNLGRVSYSAGLGVQEDVARERGQDIRPDTLLLLEHPPTITLGRRAGADDLLWSVERLRGSGIAVVAVDRGGQATYHGPGQLVGYPITRLGKGGRGVRQFVTAMEDALLDVTRWFGLTGRRRAGHPGVWFEDRKLASIGIAVHRGVSRHGFALNVAMDLDPFHAIVPCGTPGLEMTDLTRALGRKVEMTEAVSAVRAAWRARFGEIEEERMDGDEARG